MYSKVCKYCGKEYESEQRNKRYCSQECCDKAQIKNKKRKKHREVKRKEYAENREINRVLSRAYSLCEAVVELYNIPKQCQCRSFSLKGDCSGDIQRHHIDGNPFNNSPWNIVHLCTTHHKMVHDLSGNINQVDTYNEAISSVEGLSEEEKVKGIIKYTKNKIIEGTLFNSESSEILEMISYLERAQQENRTVYYVSMGKYTKEVVIKRLIEIAKRVVM